MAVIEAKFSSPLLIPQGKDVLKFGAQYVDDARLTQYIPPEGAVIKTPSLYKPDHLFDLRTIDDFKALLRVSSPYDKLIEEILLTEDNPIYAVSGRDFLDQQLLFSLIFIWDLEDPTK